MYSGSITPSSTRCVCGKRKTKSAARMAQGDRYSPKIFDSSMSTSVPAPRTPTNWYMPHRTASSTGTPHTGCMLQAPIVSSTEPTRRSGRASTSRTMASIAAMRCLWINVDNGSRRRCSARRRTSSNACMAASPMRSRSHGVSVASPANIMSARLRRLTCVWGSEGSISSTASSSAWGKRTTSEEAFWPAKESRSVSKPLRRTATVSTTRTPRRSCNSSQSMRTPRSRASSIMLRSSVKGTPISASCVDRINARRKFLASATCRTAPGRSRSKMLRVTSSSSDIGSKLLTPGVSMTSICRAPIVALPRVIVTVVPG